MADVGLVTQDGAVIVRKFRDGYASKLGETGEVGGMRRRPYLALAWVIFVVGVLPLRQSIAGPDPAVATAHIQMLTDEAAAILERPDLDLVDRERSFSVILRNGFDIGLIGRFVVGRYWAGASDDQREDFLELFGDFVVATYTPRFSSFAGESVVITGTQRIDDNDVLVVTEIGRAGDRPTPIGWRIRLRDGQPKIIDVMVHGLSLAVTQRDEFASVLRRQGVDGLLVIMEARTQRLTVAGRQS